VLGTPTVTEYWGASGPHILTLQTPEAQGGSDMFTLDPLKGYIIRSYLGLLARPSFPGLRNIEVTWTAGRNPVPPPVKLATKEYVKYWWANSQEAAFPVTVGGQYGDASSASASVEDWPSVESRIKAMLRPYMQVGVA
jgi:hypothetical protein